jgi:signal transduction histidine kinase
MTDSAAPQTRPPDRNRQRAVDVAIAVGVTVAQLAARHASAVWGAGPHAEPGWYVYLLLAVAGMALLARRRFPVGVLAVSLAASIAASRLGHGGMTWIAVIAAFLNAELAGKRLAAAASLVIGYLATCWPPWRIGEPGFTSATLALGLAAWLLALLAVAELIRSRAQRAAAVRRSQEELFRRRASEDRMRIARDLHDVLAHNISVINVQANTALHLMDRQPERAKEALTAIHAVSKQALAELRAVLGVLRDGERAEDGAPRAPSPGLARLPDLLASVRSAGLDVRLTIEGEPGPLPADADIAAYRIVQESLTNVTRHSQAGSAAVRVRFDRAGVAVDIEDDGAPAPVPAATSAAAGVAASPRARAQSFPSDRLRPAGNGIIGMAERARELGGTFDAGPKPAGGFRVAAWLPAGAAADAPAEGAGS